MNIRSTCILLLAFYTLEINANESRQTGGYFTQIGKDVTLRFIIESGIPSIRDLLNLGQTCKGMQALVKMSPKVNHAVDFEKLKVMATKEASRKENVAKEVATSLIEPFLQKYNELFYQNLKNYRDKELIKIDEEKDLAKRQILRDKLVQILRLLALFYNGLIETLIVEVFHTEITEIYKYTPDITIYDPDNVNLTLEELSIEFELSDTDEELLNVSFDTITNKIREDAINFFIGTQFDSSNAWQVALVQIFHAATIHTPRFIEDVGHTFQEIVNKKNTVLLHFQDKESLHKYLTEDIINKNLKEYLRKKQANYFPVNYGEVIEGVFRDYK